MAVRTLRPVPKWWYAPNCHMYENVPVGHIYDGDIGAYLELNGSRQDFEVIPSPTAVVPPKTVEPPAVVVVAEHGPEATGLPAAAAVITAPPAEPTTPPDEDREPAGEPFDPAAHSATAVLAHVKAHPDQAAAVRAAELAGKQRMGILSAIRD